MISKQYPYTITKNCLTIKLGYNYHIDKNQCLNRRQRFEWIHHFATAKAQVDSYLFIGVLIEALDYWEIKHDSE